MSYDGAITVSTSRSGGVGGWGLVTAQAGWKTFKVSAIPRNSSPITASVSGTPPVMETSAPFFTSDMVGKSVLFPGDDRERVILSVADSTHATLIGGPFTVSGLTFDLIDAPVAECYSGVGLVRSFALPQSDPNFRVLYKRCYLYDQAIAIICAVNMGDLVLARRWTNALLRARSPDGQFAFSVDAQSGLMIDPYYRNGAQFWCVYALLWFLKHVPSTDLATQIADAVNTFFTLANATYWTGDDAGYQTHAFRLGKGKYTLPSYEFDPDILPQACGVEHNTDAFFALQLAGEVLGNPAYTAQAAQVRETLLSRFWDAAYARAYQGISSPTEFDAAHALDAASWYSLVAHDAQDRAKQEDCLRIVEDYAVSADGVHGYTAYRPQYGYPGAEDTLWIEGTCGVILAWLAAGRVARALHEHAQLAPLLRSDGFPYVTHDDPANEMRPWTSVASSGWFILCRQPNGFWGVDNPEPDELTARPNFTRVKLGQLDDAEYKSQGFGLATPWKTTAGPKRKLTYDFTLASQVDIGQFREFIAAIDGRRLGFWLPVWLNEYKLAADGPAGSTTITIWRSKLDEAEAAFSQFRRLFLSSGDSFETHAIVGVDVVGNSEVITLDSALGVSFPARKTLCGGLLRARLADDLVEYQHIEPGVADVRLNFVELPTEYTVQHQGSRPVFLYEFRRGENTWRFANYGADIVAGGHTWAAADITHGEISSGLDMVGDELSVQVATDDPDHPLRLYLDRAAMELTTLSVYRTDADSLLVDLDAPVFTGRAKRIPFRKKGVIDLSVSTLFRLSEEAVPRLIIQRTCNHRLFDGGCGLSESAFTTAGLLVAVNSGDPPYVEASEWGAKAAAEGDLNWFALGKVKVGMEVRLCVGQDGNRLYLNAPFRSSTLGGVATATPGCDKRVGTCVGKFDNLGGHAGFPFIPSANPQLEELTTPEPNMGKK